jgi:hypothetical protein
MNRTKKKHAYYEGLVYSRHWFVLGLVSLINSLTSGKKQSTLGKAGTSEAIWNGISERCIRHMGQSLHGSLHPVVLVSAGE